MSWVTEAGRLACRWVESEESRKYDVVSMVVTWWCSPGIGFGSGTLRQLVNMLERV
jgi:hypothetical protein